MATDWDGVYVGVGVNVEQDLNNPDTFLGGTAILGVNVTMDSFLLGAEAYAGGQFEISGATAFGMLGGEVRAGVLVTEQVLLYGALVTMRAQLEAQRARVEALYLAADEA